MKCSVCNHPIEHYPTCPIISKPKGRPTHESQFIRDFGPVMAAKILAKPITHKPRTVAPNR